MSGLQTPFSGWTLPLALTTLAGIYRPAVVLQHADNLSDFDAIAHINLLLGNFSRSFGMPTSRRSSLTVTEFRLRALEADYGDERERVQHVVDVADAYIVHISQKLDDSVLRAHATPIVTSLLVCRPSSHTVDVAVVLDPTPVTS
jgi:hypothetical protein